MDVVGHQAICPDLDAGLGRRRPQEIPVEAVIRSLEEGGFPPIAALGDVVRDARDYKPGDTSHASSWRDGKEK